MNRQQELESKTDSEIERIINDIEYPQPNALSRALGPKEYCSSANDIMPLAFANDISLIKFERCKYQAMLNPVGGDCCSVYGDKIGCGGDSVYHRNPLRAACIAVILIKEGK